MRLNMPSALLQKDSVLVTRAVIDQYTEYADIAALYEKGLTW
jgi:hypothetical protein